jgi:hypothetical protein
MVDVEFSSLPLPSMYPISLTRCDYPIHLTLKITTNTTNLQNPLGHQEEALQAPQVEAYLLLALLALQTPQVEAYLLLALLALHVPLEVEVAYSCKKMLQKKKISVERHSRKGAYYC